MCWSDGFRVIICVHCPLHIDCASGAPHPRWRIRAASRRPRVLTTRPLLFGNLWIDDAFAYFRAAGAKRPSVIALHESAEANYISDEDRRPACG